MKKCFSVKVVLLAFSLLGFKAHYSQSFKDSISAVISINEENSKLITKVRSRLLTTPNTTFVGYCSNHNVFLIYLNSEVYGSAEEFVTKLIRSTGVMSLTLKQGRVEDIRNYCEFNNPDDYDKNKLQAGTK